MTIEISLANRVFSNTDTFFDPNLHPNDVANKRQKEVKLRIPICHI